MTTIWACCYENYLTAKNYETALFINGNLAFEAFPTGSFDLCILDIMNAWNGRDQACQRDSAFKSGYSNYFPHSKKSKRRYNWRLQIGSRWLHSQNLFNGGLLYRIEAILRRTTSLLWTEKWILFNRRVFVRYPWNKCLLSTIRRLNLRPKESELLELLCRHGNEILERNFALKNYLDWW